MKKAKRLLVKSNFMELMMNRVVMQTAMNMSASRSYASSLTTSLNKDDVEEGVLYFNACVNMLFMGLANTKYCLLYTSPSPRDRQKSRMPSSA